ncbi:MAG TPA: MerR family DNA-binding transcriptional regulator [Mycobacterium sp.]|nr:MerR family DNA-binding transcriptional regulator [Mycobacterium sp.]
MGTDIVYADEVARMLRRSIDTIRYWDRLGTVLPKARKLGRRKY